MNEGRLSQFSGLLSIIQTILKLCKIISESIYRPIKNYCLKEEIVPGFIQIQQYKRLIQKVSTVSL